MIKFCLHIKQSLFNKVNPIDFINCLPYLLSNIMDIELLTNKREQCENSYNFVYHYSVSYIS